HLDAVRIQEVDTAGHTVVHDVVDGGARVHQATVGRLQRLVTLHLERKVIQADRPLLYRPGPCRRSEEGEVVVHHAARQKGDSPVGAITRHLETNHIPVELGRPFDVGHVEDDVPDLFGYAHDSLPLQALEIIVHSAGPRRALLRVRGPLYHDRAVKKPSLTLTLD